MSGPWLRKHGVNVQKKLYFPLVSVFNPDYFSGKNSTLCLLLVFLQTKSQLCFSAQFLPFKVKFKSQTLFLCFFKTCLTSRGLSPHLKLQLLTLVSFSASQTPEADRLITTSVEAKVRSSNLRAASYALRALWVTGSMEQVVQRLITQSWLGVKQQSEAIKQACNGNQYQP